MKRKRETVKKNLFDLSNKLAIGAQIRSRARYIEEGEKSTQYFLGLEKHRQSNNKITKLESNGKSITNSKDILFECCAFYQNLYKSSKPNEDDIDKYIRTCKLDNYLLTDDKNLCDEKISLQECTHVVETCLKKNKSPGLDGLTAEFYKTFWSIIGPFLVQVFSEVFKTGHLSNSQKRAVISLIFKSGDRERLKNYRPISLTNTDYKILAFVLALRVQKVMKNTISDDQSGYIKNRFIGYNIRTIQDLIEYCDKFNKKGVLMFLDFKKAFDSLEWTFLKKVISKFGFGKNFQRWVNILYTGPEAVIKNNG